MVTRFLLVCLAVLAASAVSQVRSGNPILEGWYADPEAHVFENRYWIYPTYSAPYDEQRHMDAFSSTDLVTWTKHPRVLDIADITWARRALWAPSIVEKDGWYYLFFGANDIQSDDEIGGIGVARARNPDGPFKDYLGKPLIDRFHNGAQPIDQFVFKDRDGSYYIVYGGWRHCNIAKLNDDFTGFVPFPDGTTFKEITPEGYVEGAFMLLKDGKYYFMWSEGGWTGPDYAVAYAIGDSPFGPFERVGTILKQDPAIATGSGHHSVLESPSGRSYIVYHRRPLGETDRNHRVVAIEELRFDDKGFIVPVVLTHEGVAADLLASGWFPDRFRFLFDPAAAATAGKVFEVISGGLESSNTRLQLIALTAIASRPYLLMSKGLNEFTARQGLAERVLLQKLKPRVRALAGAPDRRVRQEALMAFAALDFRDEGDEWALQLGDETIALCAARYRLDEEPGVRAEAVRVIGFDDSADAAEPTIAAALHDPDAGVVATAVLGVEEHRMSAELPRLAALLAHPSVNVRIAAAGVISTFGEAAVPHLPDLERALAIEKDGVAADTMRGSITVLRGRRGA